MQKYNLYFLKIFNSSNYCKKLLRKHEQAFYEKHFEDFVMVNDTDTEGITEFKRRQLSPYFNSIGTRVFRDAGVRGCSGHGCFNGSGCGTQLDPVNDFSNDHFRIILQRRNV